VSIPANGTHVIVFNHQGVSLDPGSYRFVMWHQPAGGSWAEVQNGVYPASIDVDIVGLDNSAYEPDPYEDNDSEADAYNLSFFWTLNTADFYINGTNIHDLGDKDHFNITLPQGYDYEVYVRMHDSYNNATGGLYSNDVIFKVNDGTGWGDFYDDVEMPMAFISAAIQDADLKFMVSSFFDEYFGTYDVQVTVTRTPNGIVAIPESGTGDISVYPNPAIDHFTIQQGSAAITGIGLFSMTGQLVRTVDTDPRDAHIRISTDGLATGTYLLRMTGNRGPVTEMLHVGP